MIFNGIELFFNRITYRLYESIKKKI